MRLIVTFAVLTALSACASSLAPYDATSIPVVSLPLASAGIADARGRFREIFCAVLEARRDSVPDYEPCETALVVVGTESRGTGEPVSLVGAERPLFVGTVPGIGFGCVRNWLEPGDSITDHIRQFGYDTEVIEVDALSGSATNAAKIRDWVMDFADSNPGRDLVLLGYSKGTPDILHALVDHPEIVERVTAVISMAGAVGGSPLANDATLNQLELLTRWPDSDCDEGDGQGLESLTPRVRQNWLGSHELPSDLAYYSLVTFPHPDRVSRVLRGGYRKLEDIDGRNDGQLVFDDQFIPGSTLVAFINADHWAIAVPVARSHPFLGRTFVDQNHYPREALLESVLRFVEEDLTPAESVGHVD